jgi:hypothetical protein
MFKFWIGNEFPIDLILDLGNYSLFCLIFYYFFEKKYIDGYFLSLICILMLTPFMFNNMYIDWKLSPDQSKYLSLSHSLRNEFQFFNFERFNNLGQLKVYITGYIFAISPTLNLETFKSIAFFNRFLLVGTSFFLFKKKKIDANLVLITFLSPSLTYFSSVTLREILILVLMIWVIYFLLEKKNIFLLITLILLFLIKAQNLFILLFFISLYFYLNSNKKFYFILSISIVILFLFIFFGTDFYEALNLARKGLFLEAYGSYKGITSNNVYENLNFDLNSLIVILKSLLYFTTSPIFNAVSALKFFVIIETFLLYAYFIRELIKYKNTNILNISVVWMLVMFFSFSLYSIVVFNDGTIHRFRIGLLFFIFYGYNLHKNKILNKKLI